MKKIRFLALLMALCLLALQFTACKRPDEELKIPSGAQGSTPQAGSPAGDGEGEAQGDVSYTPLAVTDLTAEVSYTEEWPELSPDAEFCEGQMDFSVELFRRAAQKTRCKNTLISPLSVSIALAMTANGADGKTAEEMLEVLGGHSVSALNAYYGNWLLDLKNDEKATLHTANSIWIRDVAGFEAKDAFLGNNAKYYHSQVFKAPFNQIGVGKINEWVDTKTDGMIDRLVDELDPNTMMVLINALAFEAAWETPYAEKRVYNDAFYSLDGKKGTAAYLRSNESTYLEDEGAIGFLRPYAGGRYSFGALMPAEGTLEDYIGGLDGARLQAILKNAQKTAVDAHLPKFSNEYSATLNEVLKEMGMPSAFLGGFDKMSNEDLFISKVIHKTYIEVDEEGTSAAAATGVMMNKYSMAPEDPKSVKLENPFIYFILDNETNLPIFMGTVTSI